MKFSDALYEVLDKKHPRIDEMENVVTPQTAKILSILWSMLAISKNVLDDIAYIDKNNMIVSIPLQKSNSKNQTAGKKGKKNKEVDIPEISPENIPVEGSEDDNAKPEPAE